MLLLPDPKPTTKQKKWSLTRCELGKFLLGLVGKENFPSLSHILCGCFTALSIIIIVTIIINAPKGPQCECRKVQNCLEECWRKQVDTFICLAVFHPVNKTMRGFSFFIHQNNRLPFHLLGWFSLVGLTVILLSNFIFGLSSIWAWVFLSQLTPLQIHMSANVNPCCIQGNQLACNGLGTTTLSIIYQLFE